MKVLFISHDAHRAGAQLFLLQLLEWVKKTKADIVFHTLILEKGVLLNDFEKVSHAIHVFSKNSGSSSGIISRIIKKSGAKTQFSERLIKSLKRGKFDLIYANSVASIDLAVDLKVQLKCPLLLHVHELESVIADRAPRFDVLSKNVNHFIAASKLVKKNLQINHKLPARIIKVIYEFSKAKTSNSTRNRTSDKVVIGGSGTLSYRKGIDIFIQAAVLFKKRFPDRKVQFRWVGGGGNSLMQVKKEVDKAKVTDLVKIIGMVNNPGDYYSDFDIFLMTSREDPFPLVCIEAGQLGIPIICFKGVTGSEEVLKFGGGHIVPYLDLIELTDRIDDYCYDPDKLVEDGLKAKELFSKFTPNKISPEIIEVIKDTIG